VRITKLHTERLPSLPRFVDDLVEDLERLIAQAEPLGVLLDESLRRRSRRWAMPPGRSRGLSEAETRHAEAGQQSTTCKGFGSGK
jgi:hypothetical protein